MGVIRLDHGATGLDHALHEAADGLGAVVAQIDATRELLRAPPRTAASMRRAELLAKGPLSPYVQRLETLLALHSPLALDGWMRGTSTLGDVVRMVDHNTPTASLDARLHASEESR